MDERKLTELMQRRIERDLEAALFGGGTSTTQTESTTLTADSLKASMAEWDKLIRNMARSAITFVVDLAHEGPMIVYATPNDGLRYEMSWVQANEAHQHWPMKLDRILSEHCAEFVPLLAGFGEWAPKHLPMPPYEVPPETESGID